MRRNFQYTRSIATHEVRAPSDGRPGPRLRSAHPLPMRTLPTDPPEVRCTMPHPKRAGLCNERIAGVVPGTVRVTRTAEPAPGGSVYKCPRCKTDWRIEPLEQARAA